MRSSLYTIHVPLKNDHDHVLLVHGFSGAYDKVTKTTAAYLRSLEVRRKPLHGDWREEPVRSPAEAPSDETIQLLKKRGYLTEKSIEDEQKLFDRVAVTLQDVALQSPPGFVVMPTYQCNLRCPYCFQDHMRTDPKFGHLLKWMSPEMVDRVLLGMAAIEKERNVADDWERSILLFGGEPLLAEGMPSVLDLYEKARRQRPTVFSAISNGTEIDAYRDYLGPNKIASLQVTIDGAPEQHDMRRIYASGEGSFVRIAENVSMALDLGVNISVRINVDKTNVGALETLADEFIQRGWHRYKNFSSYTAPVTGHSDDYFNSYALSARMTELKKQNPKLTIIDRPSDRLRQRLLATFRGERHPRSFYKASYCGAHTSMFVIDPFGDIYACWDRTGDPGIRIGHIEENGAVTMFGRPLPPGAEATSAKKRVVLPTIKASPVKYTDVPGDEAMWRGRTVSTNEVCRSCRYAFHCGGGCAILAVENAGEFHHNYCDGFQEVFRLAVRDAYQDFLDGVVPNAARLVDCDQ